MRKKSKIANNALKVLEYLINNNAMVGGDTKVQDIYNSVGLSKEEFDSADMYLLQQKYVEGTMGGMAGSRWLAGNGIDFYEETDAVKEIGTDKPEVNQMADPKKSFCSTWA